MPRTSPAAETPAWQKGLEEVRLKHGLPGLGAALVTS